MVQQNKLHPKIQERKRQSRAVEFSGVSVDQLGTLTERISYLDKGQVEGYAIIWNARNHHGEKHIKGSCSKSIKDNGPGSSSNYKIKMLNGHNTREALGLFEELREDEIGLYFRTVPLDEWDVPGSPAYRLILQLRSGTINNFSAGWDWVWDKVEYDQTDDSIILKEVKLFEISPVAIPSDMETYVIRTKDEEDLLVDQTDEFIKSLPRQHQYEARQLFARTKSLSTLYGPSDADELQRRETTPEGKGKSAQAGPDLSYIVNKFKL